MNQVYWVTHKLGFSGHQNLYDAGQLQAMGIGAILNTTQRPDPKWPPPIVGLNDPAKDDGLPKPVVWFGRGITFTRRYMLHTRVLIHCEAGINRSPAMTYAVLRSLGNSPEESVIMIHRARGEANPFKYQHDAEQALQSLGFTHADVSEEASSN